MATLLAARLPPRGRESWDLEVAILPVIEPLFEILFTSDPCETAETLAVVIPG